MANAMKALSGSMYVSTHHKLNNNTAIIDRNGLQQTGTSDDIMSLVSLSRKFNSFSWEVFEVNGHNLSELIDVFNKDTSDKPSNYRKSN